jgi:hypothetical protein
LKEQSRIYEASVKNHLESTKILERIFHAYNYQEILTYLKEFTITDISLNQSSVKKRFFNKCAVFFHLINPNELDFDEKLKAKIEEIVNQNKDEI